ncbi:hypothetical protein BC829DRAFT_382421 [Chytridium lagenaria]|nr:hypothetical protein BC829DRAFT_382421 [Chytridium lagenaria]
MMRALLYSFIAVMAFAVTKAFAHGYMTSPPIRLQPGDSNNGLTFARTANTAACQGLPRGNTMATVSGNSFNVQYVLTAPHRGGCVVYMSLSGDGGWQEIGRDDRCGYGGGGTIPVRITQTGTYDAVIRWYYWTDNFTGEVYNNCADVRINNGAGAPQPQPQLPQQPEPLPPQLPPAPTAAPAPPAPPAPQPAPVPAPQPTQRPRPGPIPDERCQDGKYRCSSPSTYQICQASQWTVSLSCGNGFRCNASNPATPCVVGGGASSGDSDAPPRDVPQIEPAKPDDVNWGEPSVHPPVAPPSFPPATQELAATSSNRCTNPGFYQCASAMEYQICQTDMTWTVKLLCGNGFRCPQGVTPLSNPCVLAENAMQVGLRAAGERNRLMLESVAHALSGNKIASFNDVLATNNVAMAASGCRSGGYQCASGTHYQICQDGAWREPLFCGPGGLPSPCVVPSVGEVAPEPAPPQIVAPVAPPQPVAPVVPVAPTVQEPTVQRPPPQAQPGPAAPIVTLDPAPQQLPAPTVENPPTQQPAPVELPPSQPPVELPPTQLPPTLPQQPPTQLPPTDPQQPPLPPQQPPTEIPQQPPTELPPPSQQPTIPQQPVAPAQPGPGLSVVLTIPNSDRPPSSISVQLQGNAKPGEVVNVTKRNLRRRGFKIM